MRNPQNEEGAYGDTLGTERISAEEVREVLAKARNSHEGSSP
jgi:hypothetical protein